MYFKCGFERLSSSQWADYLKNLNNKPRYEEICPKYNWRYTCTFLETYRQMSTSNTEKSSINGHSEPSQSYILSALIATLDIKKLVPSTFRDINVLSWKYIAKCTSEMDFCHTKFSILAAEKLKYMTDFKCRDHKNRDKSSFTVHTE